MPRQTCHRTLHHRVAVGSRRGDHRARLVENEGSTVRADGLAAQQRDESVLALSVYRRRRTCQVVVEPHADARRRFLMESGRQPRRIIVRTAESDNRGGADHHEHQRDERREDEDPDRQAFRHRACLPGVLPRPASQIHSLFPIARSLTCPGISAQNQPNRLASGNATRKAPGARSHVTAKREEQRRRDVPVGDGGGELARADESPHHRIEQHDQHDEHAVAPPRPHAAEIWIAADELVGHPDKRRPEEIALRPAQDEVRRHALDQVRQHVRRRDGDQCRIAEEHDAQQDDQILQGLERLCAGTSTMNDPM